MLKLSITSALMIAWGFAAWSESQAKDIEISEQAQSLVMDHDADLEAAEGIFRKSCRACHGNKAQGAASYPKLSDKEPDYIAEMLQRYRSGEKFGPNSILMIQNAKKLTDEDIANLAVYITTAFD